METDAKKQIGAVEAIGKMMVLSAELDSPVTAVYNGVTITVSPDSKPSEVLQEFHKKLYGDA